VSSREQQVLAEMLARLNGTALGVLTKPAGFVAERSRLREVAPTQLPAVSIYPMEANTERKGAISETTLAVKIAIWVKGTGTAAVPVPIDQDLDPLWLWVHQQLITDESLGGLAIRVEPTQKTWGFNLAQGPFGDLDLHYLVTFRHQSNNPSLG